MSSDGKKPGSPPFDPQKFQEMVVREQNKLRLARQEEAHDEEVTQLRIEHLRQLRLARLEAENKGMAAALALAEGKSAVSSVPVAGAGSSSPPIAAPVTKTSPRLSEVIDQFMASPLRKKSEQMLKKYKVVLPLFLEVVGNKLICELDQDDINRFFDIVGRLPPKWSAACKKQGISAVELAAVEHDLTLGPKSFIDTYLACIRPFLKEARRGWQTKGFPVMLTLEGIEYMGDRDEGEQKQRAFQPQELKRLFEGPEMAAFAHDPALAHCYWLPHIGLFSGARVNEICQMNPQVDIVQDSETGVWYFWITEDTAADSRVVKSVKTEDARKVPIHKKLIELGFLDYVEKVKKSGATLLFPNWKPINKRASGEAEKWFRKFLRDIGIRDETPKARLVGMHAFRHTLLTYGARQRPPLSLFCITGHAVGDTPIPASGAGKGYLTLSLLSPIEERASLLDQLQYDITFHKPSNS